MQKTLIPTGRKELNRFDFPLREPQYPTINTGFVQNRALTILSDNSSAYITDAFSANSTVYSIVTIISRKFATIPLLEYRTRAEAKQADVARYKCIKQGFTSKSIKKLNEFRIKAFEEVEGKVSKLLDAPNKSQSRSDFLEQCLGYKLITGECFIRVIRRGENNDGEPLELELLPPQFVTIVSDGSLYGVKEYVFSMGTETKRYQPNEIIHWKYGNPNVNTGGGHLHGLSPLRAGATDVSANTSGKRAASYMFQNQGANGFIAPREIMQEWGPEQAKDINDRINSKVNGIENKGKAFSVAVPLTWQQIGMNAVDMSLIEANRLTKNDICALYNFPLNLIENTHSIENNIEQDNKRLVTGCVLSECESFEDVINTKLIPMFKDSRTITGFDYTALPEMQVDMEKMANVMDKAWYLTPNEKREVMNYDIDPDENMNKKYVSSSLVPLDQLNLPMGEPLEDELDKAGINDYKI